MSENIVVRVKKRAWYVWLLWAVWIALLLFLAQNAIASARELESRASMIFWISFGVALIAGAVIWFVRRNE